MLLDIPGSVASQTPDPAKVRCFLTRVHGPVTRFVRVQNLGLSELAARGRERERERERRFGLRVSAWAKGPAILPHRCSVGVLRVQGPGSCDPLVPAEFVGTR